MKRYSPTNYALTAILILFTRPLWLMFLFEYFQDDFGLPEFGYWKCFWLLFAAYMFHPLTYITKDYKEQFTEDV